ncbi:MAG: hypothetical protein ACRC3Z_08905 [Phocaeicola sp.]
MAGKCIQLADIDEAQLCADLDNVGGVVQDFIYGYWDEVATWPDLPKPAGEDGMSMLEAGEWDGDLAMKAGCKAHKFVFTDETGELTITDQGETGGESCKFEFSLIRAKMSAQIFGFENAIRGRRIFIISRDKNGNAYLMGDKLTAARKVVADASTTGKAASERNQLPLKFAYDCPRKLMYTGDTTKLLTAAV